jgi:plasmid stability protein
LTFKRYSHFMKNVQKRATIYFDPDLHRALRVKAAETERSMSELVNQAVKLSLAEDAEDIATFEERQHEPNLLFEDVLKDLKLRGKI